MAIVACSQNFDVWLKTVSDIFRIVGCTVPLLANFNLLSKPLKQPLPQAMWQTKQGRKYVSVKLFFQRMQQPCPESLKLKLFARILALCSFCKSTYKRQVGRSYCVFEEDSWDQSAPVGRLGGSAATPYILVLAAHRSYTGSLF